MTERSSVVLVLGILGRSGTNHLHDLLRTHPALSPVHGLWEDHLVRHLTELEVLRTQLETRWQHQPIGAAGTDALAISFGEGLLSFLDQRTPDAIPLLKTPSPVGLRHLPTFLPSARAIVIIRDARDVAESCVKTFGSTRQRWLREWRDGAREILAAMSEPTVAAQTHLIRYEDLVTDRHGVLAEICDFLSLSRLAASPEELDSTPVRGSSDLAGGGVIHWKPVDMGDGFSPVQRYRRWTARDLRHADVLVGRELEAFGYARTAPARKLDPITRGALLASHVIVSGRESATVRLRRVRRNAGAVFK